MAKIPLRRLLEIRLPYDSDLDAFCIDYFPKVAMRFTGGMDRVAKINILLIGATPDEILSKIQEFGEIDKAKEETEEEQFYKIESDIPTALAPISGAALMQAHKRLEKILTKFFERAFTTEALWGFILDLPHGQEILDEIKNSSRRMRISPSSATQRMLRRKLINAEFFDRLQKIKPQYMADIKIVYQAWADAVLPESLNPFVGKRFLTNSLREILKTNQKIGSLFCLIYIDIDDFTVINHRYGWELGDKIIQIIHRLAEINCQARYAFRCGKDEFFALLENINEQEATARAASLSKHIEEYLWSSLASGLRVTASIGIVQLRENEDPYDFVVRAIHGSIRAKEKGRNCVEKGPFALARNTSRNIDDYGS